MTEQQTQKEIQDLKKQIKLLEKVCLQKIRSLDGDIKDTKKGIKKIKADLSWLYANVQKQMKIF